MSKSTPSDSLCRGPILRMMIAFALPLAAMNIIQTLFNAADQAVIARFGAPGSVAAVGGSGSLSHLLVTFFIGLAIGSNVLVAQHIGARNGAEVSKTVHTSIATAVYGGLLMIGLGILALGPALRLMKVPAEVFPRQWTYLAIICAGIPVDLLVNFGAAILRAVGDTKRPLYYLTAAGVVNVGFNLFFVIVWHLDVAGVALATVLSKCVSAALILRALAREKGDIRLDFRKVRIDPRVLGSLVRVGLPAGIQSACFALSNTVIQSAVNTLGVDAMSGNAAGQQIEGFVWVSGNAFSLAVTSFVGQNYGARDFDRIRSSVRCGLACVAVAMGAMGALGILFGPPLVALFAGDNPTIVGYGMSRVRIVLSVYFLCQFMDVYANGLRGMGQSVLPMVNTILGTCVLRILWIAFIFPIFPSIPCVALSWVASWIVTGSVNAFFFYREFFRLKRLSANAVY